jgi:hypothetical protein
MNPGNADCNFSEANPTREEGPMQIKDRDYTSQPDWSFVDEPVSHRQGNSFHTGFGVNQSVSEEDETVSGTIDLGSEPEQLEEEDRVGEETRPRR